MPGSSTLKSGSTIPLPAIATIICDGILFDPKNWSPLMNTPEPNTILDRVNRLFATLNDRGISYVLVGGVAMLGYIQGRNTQDVDLIMSQVDGLALGLVIGHENQDFAETDYDGIRVDLLLDRNALFRLIKNAYTTVLQFGDQAVITATPEGLVVLKLYALSSLYRQGQFDRAALYETDILQLVLNYELALERLLQIVQPYVLESDFTELVEITQDIQKRIRRMKRN